MGVMGSSLPGHGPLAGISLVEIAAIGPVPFAGMILSDLGADVLRIDRLDSPTASPPAPVDRGRRSMAVDLKSPEGRHIALEVIGQVDGLIEGFRPGVMEGLGLGPDVVLGENARLVYGRMTGWGQEGPLAGAAGHDVNYIALSGSLGHIGRSGAPPDLPLNLIGDYGGGAMLLVAGMLAGLLEAGRSGRGQVVDAAMVDGSALLMAATCGMIARGQWSAVRGENLLDGGAPFYGVYETADHRFIAVGAVEKRFHQVLAELADIPSEWLVDRMDRAKWPEMRRRMAELFASRTCDEWLARFEGSDSCVAPVLQVTEAAAHPHLAARSTYIVESGVLQPAPAPRFDRTPAGIGRPAPRRGGHTKEVLAALGYSNEQIADLAANRVIGLS